MTVSDLRAAMDEIDHLVRQHRYDEIAPVIARVKQELAADRLLTTREAAALLQIGSVNTVKAMAHAGKIGYVMHGSHMRIPLSEVARVQDTAIVRDMRALERLHDETAILGSDDGMSEDALMDLSMSRPGKLPWQT